LIIFTEICFSHFFLYDLRFSDVFVLHSYSYLRDDDSRKRLKEKQHLVLVPMFAEEGKVTQSKMELVGSKESIDKIDVSLLPPKKR
jgi:hypothetical protein